MNKQDLKVLELKITADAEGAKKGFNSLVSSTNNFFDSLKSRLGSIRTLQKDIALENQAIQKEQATIDNKVKKAETERARALERLNNVPKYKEYNTIDKVTARIQEQNKALQGTLETQSKIEEAFLKNPVDFYKNLFSKNIVSKGIEIPFSQFMTNFTNTGITKRIKDAYNKYVRTNPIQFFPRVPIKDIKPDIDNDFLQYTQRKGEVYKGAKNEKIYGTKEEQEAQNKRVANFLAAQRIITPEKHLTEFKNKTTIDSITKDIKELENLREKITQYNDTEKKLTQTNESATKAREVLAPRIAELQNKRTQLPEQIQGLKNDIVSIINSGRLNAEVQDLIKNGFDRPRLQSRLQEMHRDVIRPAQDYLYLKGLETPITSRNISDFEHEMEIRKIPEADRKELKTFFNQVAGVVDARDQIKNIVSRTKATDKIITELAKVKALPAIDDLKPTTDLATLATYQGHEKTASNVYRKVNKILSQLGVDLPETYDKTAVQRAVDSLVGRYQLNDLEKQRIQDATVNLDALYNRKTALSEVIKQSQELQNKNKSLIEEKNRTAYLEKINEQTKDLKVDFDKLTSKNEALQLFAGNKLSPEVFNNLGIRDLSSNIKKLGQVQVEELKKLGIGIEWGATDKAFGQALGRAIAQGRVDYSNQTQKKEIENLRDNYFQLRNQHTALTGLADVQNRRASAQTTAVADAKKQEKNIQDEINSRNMQLYAMSHALKAIEAPIQQAVDVSKGNIDEYVKFQSAMVGVAKLLPVLRDKDTLLVNDKFKEFRQGILDMTNYLPRSGVELAQAAESASRLGVTNPDQIRKVVEAGTMLGNAFGMAPNDVTTQIVKIANAKGINLNAENSIDQVMKFADAINYLDDHTAATGRDILNFTKRAVQTAEGVKMSTEDVAAFGATMVSLGISADQANTGFKNFMTVLQTGPRNKNKGHEYFEKSGLKVEEVMRAFKENPTQTAVEFIKRLNKLRNAPAGQDAAAIVRFAFGQQASQPLMALVNNPEVLEKYIKEARFDSEGWTLKEHTAKQINDPAVKFKLLQQKIQKLQIDTGEILMPVAEKFIATIKGMADALTPFVKDNSNIIQNTAYTSAGLLLAVKGAGFLVDTATIFNNLRNWKGVQNFGTKWADMMSKSYTLNKVLGGLAKPLEWGQKLLNWAPFGAGVGGVAGAGGWTLGSMLLGIPMAALTGWGIGRGIATWHGFDGKADSIDDWFFKNGIIYKSDKAITKARGTVKDTKRRNTAQNSSVFLSRKYQELVNRLNTKGYNFKEGQLFQNNKALNYEIYNSSLPFLTDYLDPSVRYIKGGKMGLVSEVDDPELFSLIDQIKEIYAKTKGARAREGILKEGKGTSYNKFRDRQIEVAENRVKLEEELSAHLGLAYKYGQEGNKLLQHYEEMKANEVKGTLKKTKDWQKKARQIAEENQDKNLTEEQWQNLYASVLDTKLKKPEEKKKEEENKKSRLQELNSLDDFVINSITGKELKKERDKLNFERATELYKSILAMRDLRATNQDLYNKEGGDKQYQKYTDWFVGLQATIAKQQGLGTDPYSMNAVLQEITDKWLSNQKAIKDSEGQVAKYQEAMKKAEEENKKSIDNTKQQLTDLTQNPWEVKLKANTADFDQAVTNSVNKAKAQLATIGNTGGGGDKPPQGYNTQK